MTSYEQTILRTYLLRIAGISSEDEFVAEEFIESSDEFKATLAEAKAYALGCADGGLQKEAMASTYDGIMRNLVEVLMADRQRRTHSQDWEYLPVGPEGPRPWGNAT